MTDVNRIEGIVSIMQRFRLERLRAFKVAGSVDEDALPASLSREAEALVILKYVLTGNNETELFVGHNSKANV